MPATDVYLYAGEVWPGDIILHDPRVPRGTFAGTATLDQAQDMSARGDLIPWGVVLYPMGQLIAGASAVYPAVGDVDAGTNYGPTGAEYTGTLVQPSVGNVLSGVNYGAGGTEFTGTLNATGSGGATTARRGILI
jgi:hypothetical protein